MMPRFVIRAVILPAIVIVAGTGCTSIFQTSYRQTFDGRFDLDPAGFVRNWAVAPPEYKQHYEGRTESGAMTVKQVKWVTELPKNIALHAPGPYGQPWRYHDAGENIFLEIGQRVPHPSAGRTCAAVDLVAPKDMQVQARLYIAGWVTVWLNEEHLGQFHGSPEDITLRLREGRNRFVAHLQNGGLRGILLKVGLQLPGQTGTVQVVLPGTDKLNADIERAQNWFQTLKVVGADTLDAPTPPPYPVTVNAGGLDLKWPVARAEFKLPDKDIFRFSAEIDIEGQILKRQFEIPANHSVIKDPDPDRGIDAHRSGIVEKMAAMSYPTVEMSKPSRAYLFNGIIRHIQGKPPVEEPLARDEALDKIRKHIASADFDLIIALRFYCLGVGTKQDREQIKEAALGFRYWQDEPGKDNLCFHSENHRVMFHGSQMIAGKLWPDDTFTNSGNTGRKQYQLGRERIIGWLEDIEDDGFEEFISTAYVPITMAATMNLIDFTDDAEIIQRATRIVDRMFRMIAEHSFDGVTIGPQGRTYRDFIYPHATSTQAILSYATPAAIETENLWATFLASSPKYRPPTGLETLMQSPIYRQYHEWHFLVTLKKTADYMLSSVEVPKYAKDPSATGAQMTPGFHGYQQHIWHATLARDCHVFTNHPGSTNDLSGRRPGYWPGNGVVPRQTQRGNMLLQIFNIPEEYPIKFTHAYWPGKVFDRRKARGNWVFGQKDTGYIGLWCSTLPETYDQVITGRELRAYADKAAWVCVCSGKSEDRSFTSFTRSCEDLNPTFDPDTLTLYIEDQKPLHWHTEPPGKAKGGG